MITYGFSAAVRYVIVYCHCGRTYACSFTVIFIHSVHRCLVLLGTSQHPGVERDRCGERGQAKNAVSVTMKLSVLLGLSFVLFLAFCHDLWASLYSGSAVIVSEFAAIAPLLIVSIVLDSAQGVLSGEIDRAPGHRRLNEVARSIGSMPLEDGNDSSTRTHERRRVEGLRVAASRGAHQPGGFLPRRHAAGDLLRFQAQVVHQGKRSVRQ